LLLSYDLQFKFFERNSVATICIEALHDPHGVLALERYSNSQTQRVEFVDGDESRTVFVVLLEDVVDASLEVHGRRNLLQYACLESLQTVLDDGFVSSGQFWVLEDHLGGRKHLDEVVVVRDAHGEFLVVDLELGYRHLAVAVACCAFEVVQKLA